MSEVWPLFDLVVTTPRIVLRYPRDDDLARVADAAASGIHAPEDMPFYVPWSRAESPVLERSVLQFAWSARGSLCATDWTLPFAVFDDGEAVGFQQLSAKEFPTTRAVESGSWLARHAQGRGIGKEMRAAVLHLAFEHLRAVEAYSASFDDNPVSEAVSRANGYRPNGESLHAVEGRPARSRKWVLKREWWLEQRRADIRVDGVEGCRSLLGVPTDGDA